MSHPDDVVRGYSPDVMKRLLSYLKPYKVAVALTLLTLVGATAAELLAPVVMKRALDENLLRREYRLDIEAVSGGLPNEELAAELLSGGRRIGRGLYVATAALQDLNRQEKQAARDAGWMDSGDWYVFRTEDTDAEGVMNAHPDLFEGENGLYAISLDDRRTLNPSERRLIQSDDAEGLRRRSTQYLVLLLATLAFTFAQVYAASWIGQKVMADMRGGLLSHVMRQSLGYLGRTPVGSLVSRIANDVETIAEFFTNVTTSFLKDAAIMAGVIGVLFALDSRLAWISLITLIPTFILIVVFRNRMRESFRRVRSRVSAVNSFLSERIGGMSTVQLFDAERRSSDEFMEKGGDLLRAEIGQMRIMAVFRPIIDLIASTAVALVIWYSAGLYESGWVTLGVLIAFVELIQKFFRPVTDIAEKFNILQSAMAGGERIFAMMDHVDRIPDGGDATVSCNDEDEPVCGEIRFDNVHFSYVPGEPVLRGLDFTIKAGSTIAVVGATGAGKTTIANLITRLWDPQDGQVLLDGRNVKDRPLDELRRSVQPVQQDVFLFAGTIADNIDLGSGFSREKIVAAATLARANVFIDKLPNDYDTLITENAGNLSAGQRQLIAFARIIAHDPRVIILDEATANVDTETESLLQQGLDRLLENRTAIIIAHRLSTIRRADRILVLGHGRLLEEGTHEELMIHGGVYRNLYQLQFSESAI